MKNMLVGIATLLFTICIPNIGQCENSISLPADKPTMASTGTRSGYVLDAITEKPVADAIIVYHWNIRDFSFEGGSTRFGAIYETFTDKEGKYTIPNQVVRIEHSASSHLDAEEVFIYKHNYVFYRMLDNEPQHFIICVPNLPHIHRKQNNIVKLQPWNDQMSHAEHLEFIPRDEFNIDKLKFLPKALANENILADEEKKVTESIAKKVTEALSQFTIDTALYKDKQITKDEYINRLHHHLATPDADLLKSASLALKDCNDTAAIPALIAFIKRNMYRREAFEVGFSALCTAINNTDISMPVSMPDRKRLIAEIESWWDRNKDKSPARWQSDDLAKLASQLEEQANSWRPLYNVSGTFRLISGEVEDANTSPVMTVFKKFKKALIEDDVNSVRDCFADGFGKERAAQLITLRQKFKDMANDMKKMVLVSEEEYMANYDLVREENGEMFAYPVIFVRDEFGNWKISDF